ncbi:protein rep [Clostridium sp. D33t1_170424_F3]|uniref:protein rep n=1 Tax=Clostridium sp. D33t1_170424_F3 TaxID=2787099 RepID=UPI0018A889A5|nr:protein rep [Clostridium sp. D33t1_170424_F3]
MHKEYAFLVATAMQELPGWESKARHLLECGTYLELDEEGHVVKSNLCRERFCPMCQWRRSLRVYGQTQKILSFLEPQGLAYLHLTLTIPNCSAADLKAQCKWLFWRSAALFSDRLYGKTDQLSRFCHFKRSFKGVLRSLEITYNPDRDDYHPHLHCLVAVRPSYFKSRDYVSQETLRLLWTGYSAGMFGDPPDGLWQVYVSRIKEGERNNAVAEVAKYAVKPFHMDLDIEGYKKVLPVLHEAMAGRRLIQLFGVFADAARQLRINLNDDQEAAVSQGPTRKFSYVDGQYREVF